jgi:hypothetical protein
MGKTLYPTLIVALVQLFKKATNGPSWMSHNKSLWHEKEIPLPKCWQMCCGLPKGLCDEKLILLGGQAHSSTTS